MKLSALHANSTRKQKERCWKGRAAGAEDQRGKHIVYMYGIVEEQI